MSEEVKCTKCGSDETTFRKTWSMKSPNSQSSVHVRLYSCKACRKSFRTYGKK